MNLLLNRASPWADVDSYLPYAGQVDVKVKRPLVEVTLRVPEWVGPGSPQVRATRGKTPVEPAWRGRYVSLGPARPGETLSLTLGGFWPSGLLPESGGILRMIGCTAT